MKRVLAVAALVATLALTGCAGHARVPGAAVQPAGTTTTQPASTPAATTPAAPAGASTSSQISSIDSQLNGIDSMLSGIDSNITSADKAADSDN